jgi:hypothetical protein
MGLKDNASLALIPAAYKTSKIYSAIPTDGDGDFTFTRSGNAIRVNKAGLVETMGTNIGRLNYDLTNGTPASCPSLLLEPTRTNNASRRETPQDGSWSDPLNEWTLLTETTTSPRGDQTRVFDLEDSTGTLIRCQDFSVAAGTYTISFYIKDIGGNLTGGLVDLGDEGTGDTTPSLSTVGSEWVRVSRTITTTSTKLFLDIEPNFTGSTNKVGIWGLQLEAGSYPTSYIQTTGIAAVTRTQDRCFNGGDANLFNDSEGVLFVDLEALGEGTTTRKISLSNGNTSFVNFNFNATSGKVSFEFGSTLNSFYILNSTGHTLTNRNKIAIKYKSGDTDCFINGTRVTGNNGTFSLSGLDRVNFENRATNGSQNMFAKIHQLMVFNEVLSDSELQTLTS